MSALNTPDAKEELSSLESSPPIKKSRRWVPEPLRPLIYVPLITIMLGLAILIEVLLAVANKQKGFRFKGIENPGASNFLHSFLPVLVITPITQYWGGLMLEVLRLQPYVSASKGNASPETTVLLDYAGLGIAGAAYKAFRLRHKLVIITLIMSSAATYLFASLTAALFVIQASEYEFEGTIDTVTVLGLRPDFSDLNAFAAAAGYAQAAVLHGLDDPPFVWQGFSMPAFNVSTVKDQISKNGTILYKSLGAQTDPRCAAATVSTPTLQANGSYSITGTYQGCSASAVSNPNDREKFGVLLVENCPINGTIPDDQFKPIMFWFFSSSPPAASMVFCSPLVKIYNVIANVSIADNVLQNVQTLEEWDGTTNVTSGSPLYGLGLNGMFFGPPADEFVLARNIAIRSFLPGAVFRLADNEVGIINAINEPDGLLQWILDKYTQYLAMSAKSNYFLSVNDAQKAQFIAFQLRLYLDPYAVHALAALFCAVSLLAVYFHIFHARDRSNLFLAGPVGSIASTVSLTSRARFGEELAATDTEADLARKVKGLRFGIDEETRQIVVDGEDAEHTRAHEKDVENVPATPTSPLSPRVEMLKGVRQSQHGSLTSPHSPSFAPSPSA